MGLVQRAEGPPTHLPSHTFLQANDLRDPLSVQERSNAV
jgi:hypothetical protein